MADGGQVLGWGLWNAQLTEWFNPGTRRPFYPTREAAERMVPMARRQYSMGTWELREYRLEDLEADPNQPELEPDEAPAR